jgi:peroxiredoxin
MRSKGVDVRYLMALMGLCMLGTNTVLADEIQLKDGTSFAGQVLQVRGDRMLVVLDRATVSSVDGESLPDAFAVGQAAPTFSGVDLAGKRHAVTADGGPITLIKFWATWCPYCRKDIKMMRDLTATYGQRGFRILAVSVDQDEKKLREFVKADPLSYAVILDAPQAAANGKSIADLYQAEGIPAYFLDPYSSKVSMWGSWSKHCSMANNCRRPARSTNHDTISCDAC